MRIIFTIGLDLAKKVFQVHAVDAVGKVVVARKLRRKEVLALFAKLPPCLVGMGCSVIFHGDVPTIVEL
jgi:transposase